MEETQVDPYKGWSVRQSQKKDVGGRDGSSQIIKCNGQSKTMGLRFYQEAKV